MRRRRYLAASLGLAVTVTSGTGQNGAEEDTFEGPDPITVSGSGATVTDAFELDEGVTIAEAVHDGEGNFIVELVPVDDGPEQLLVNVIGSYEGGTGLLAEAGRYLLDVDADGQWELEVNQPRANEDDASELPIAIDGAGSDWAGPLLFGGLSEAYGTHDGTGNFIVEILPQEGTTLGLPFPELLFNELDQFEGETTFDLEGVGYVTVEADGQWELELGAV